MKVTSFKYFLTLVQLQMLVDHKRAAFYHTLDKTDTACLLLTDWRVKKLHEKC